MGHAPLSSLAELEPDAVRIRGSLVRGIERRPVRREIVRLLRTLCRGAHIRCLAADVETEAERDALVEVGCDLLQGPLFAAEGEGLAAVGW